ncbi:2-acylglycerol O-acyltransferase 2-A-like [Pseudomyrmex gracilis]|uniref:2-acylglycerol O-acyltransferase 2-A-like n=1 Tax=Pseudomyrmex gracilis TaxID=219809 RepID=UPI000994E165|nr:2-acylglycerol O-acyltransferase 2-A-like [Pseudomyrmex gracilis]XP_020287976.1 2-acylglycerol O-acyltransferase 2-A-like [Pseudomyrmex gracilis]XP_020287978.1 2-acylglycerol O-acyltransferase 2-A-like [Pseudomyrmex gracilis]XP_020287979.1 2-acylglycerol O-acyltransferase 2-A-like [Pseudomyrmex gracilis]XP_020287980.1 2-acylglycerol O-acyltransferase 2-A-like [Pseudomyrmex gracilis]
MNILGVKFAPLNVPLERRLQTLAAATWFVILSLNGVLGFLIAGYLLLYTQTIRYLMLLYLVWMYYDWDTCNRGGRSHRWTGWARNNPYCRLLCDYYPAKLVKTADLNPNKTYVFVYVPHGILPTGMMCAFGTDVLGFKDLFPGLEIRSVVLDQHFMTPFFREYTLAGGCIASNARSLEYALSSPPEEPYTGKAVTLIPGGASEALESKPGTYRTLIKRRKGFVKLALKNGAALVPVISFGETNLYNQLHAPEGSLLRRVQNWIRKYIGLAPVIISGRGFFQYSFGLIPKRSPITVVVGSSLELPKMSTPTSEQIDEYHKKFVNLLSTTFETEKHKYIKDAEKTTLEFL